MMSASEEHDTDAGAPVRPAPPIESRFLFVDVAAQRAKQLRRGALPRLPHLRPDPASGQRSDPAMKLERVAMEEVRQGLVEYELPNGQPDRGQEDV